MKREVVWENQSVLKFAQDIDPVEKMEETAQSLVLDAVDMGWQGPPFDPLELAALRGIVVRPNASVPDARIFQETSNYIIEYNPNKSLGRVNFSIAHEIAHTFFDDWAEKTRYRTKQSIDEKNWQLEMLCNIGAAEILMPIGSISDNFDTPKPIEEVMKLRQRFQVSTEAMLIRMAKVAKFPAISFAVSKVKTDKGSEYRLDYAIPSSSWPHGKVEGLKIKDSRCFDECVAIGTTSNAIEIWSDDLPELKVEAVGLPPYPGTSEIRIAGFAYPNNDGKTLSSKIEYRHGDASEFSSSSDSAIVHLVNNKARSWGGFGFARALARKYPSANADYRRWVTNFKEKFRLGNFHSFSIEENRYIASLIAQSGYGESSKPRIRYSALYAAFEKLAEYLIEKNILDVQMPRIGAGQAGGNWNVIEGIILETLVLRNINVKIYDLPPK
ncbi:ImmA/IrrE family metallo-endopeptidase [Emcibacter nanhaiensis]|nr:ImmA/IrrE family metallo-endopeptidase [Emcibacter nanhaiensis]